MSNEPDKFAMPEYKLGYEQGKRMAYTSWVSEREDIIRVLRELCEDYGDNDWPNDSHLGDVLEKHLKSYLGRGDE